jgi:hypothetical protein
MEGEAGGTGRGERRLPAARARLTPCRHSSHQRAPSSAWPWPRRSCVATRPAASRWAGVVVRREAGLERVRRLVVVGRPARQAHPAVIRTARLPNRDPWSRQPPGLFSCSRSPVSDRQRDDEASRWAASTTSTSCSRSIIIRTAAVRREPSFSARPRRRPTAGQSRGCSASLSSRTARSWERGPAAGRRMMWTISCVVRSLFVVWICRLDGPEADAPSDRPPFRRGLCAQRDLMPDATDDVLYVDGLADSSELCQSY